MLAEDIGDALPGEGVAEAQPPRDLGDDPPVRPRLAGRRQERSLARDAAFGIGDRAVLLRPAAPGPPPPPSGLGRLATGLVAMIHTALISPRSSASKRSTAFRPGCVAMRAARQKRPTRSMSAGVKSMCAASVLESAPTSRPPMALGCPVIENGPMPGRPMRPVRRWQLIRAFTLST